MGHWQAIPSSLLAYYVHLLQPFLFYSRIVSFMKPASFLGDQQQITPGLCCQEQSAMLGPETRFVSFINSSMQQWMVLESMDVLLFSWSTQTESK